MIFSNSIKSGVMKVIKAKVAAAQKAHDEECKELDKTCETEQMAAKARRDRGKKDSAEKHINSIIGKFI